MTDPMRLEIDPDGVLVQRGRDEWREPVCSSCGEPIKWVLDMASFTHDPQRGGYSYQHARCAWKPGAFRLQERAARKMRPQPPGATPGTTQETP